MMRRIFARPHGSARRRKNRKTVDYGRGKSHRAEIDGSRSGNSRCWYLTFQCHQNSRVLERIIDVSESLWQMGAENGDGRPNFPNVVLRNGKICQTLLLQAMRRESITLQSKQKSLECRRSNSRKKTQFQQLAERTGGNLLRVGHIMTAKMQEGDCVGKKFVVRTLEHKKNLNKRVFDFFKLGLLPGKSRTVYVYKNYII